MAITGPLMETNQTATKRIDAKNLVYAQSEFAKVLLTLIPVGSNTVQKEFKHPIMVPARGAPKAWKENTPVSEYKSQGRDMQRNLTQMLKEVWKVSDRAEETETYGVADEVKFQKAQALMRLRDQLEILFGLDQDIAAEGDSGNSDGDKTRTLFNWLSNTSFNSEYPVAAKYRVTAAANHIAALSGLTEESFKAQMRQARTDFGSQLALTGLVGGTLKDQIDGWMAQLDYAAEQDVPLRRYNVQAKDGLIIQSVERLKFSSGTVDLIETDNLLMELNSETGEYEASEYTPRSGLFIKSSNWEQRFQRGVESEDLAKDGSGTAGLYRCSVGLCAKVIRGQFVIKASS